MTIEVATANGEVVKVRLVKGKPVADIDALRKYHREYYRLNKQECECERCNAKFTSQSRLVRHQRRNQKCALQRARTELEILRNGQVTKTNLRQMYKLRHYSSPSPLGLRLHSSTSTSSTSSTHCVGAINTVARRRMRSACHQPALPSQARLATSITFKIK